MVAYELLFGKRPYRGKTNSSLTQSILKESMRFPEEIGINGAISKEGLDCIRGVSKFSFTAIDERFLIFFGTFLSC